MPTITRFEEIEAWKVFDLADKSFRPTARFMDYLETHPQSRRVREEGSGYEV
jgi:hypothetical protein